MLLSRERTDVLFRLHAKEQGLNILKMERLGDFTYQVLMLVENDKGEKRQETFKALVLARSWDYWEYRLSFSAPSVSLIICSHHDSLLPVHCLEVGSSGYTYAPREKPLDAAPQGAKRTKRTARLFLGALLSGEQEAFNALAAMHISSQKRYRRRMELLLTKNRMGHQLYIAQELRQAV